eukprot:gene12771-14982_t
MDGTPDLLFQVASRRSVGQVTSIDVGQLRKKSTDDRIIRHCGQELEDSNISLVVTLTLHLHDIDTFNVNGNIEILEYLWASGHSRPTYKIIVNYLDLVSPSQRSFEHIRLLAKMASGRTEHIGQALVYAARTDDTDLYRFINDAVRGGGGITRLQRDEIIEHACANGNNAIIDDIEIEDSDMVYYRSLDTDFIRRIYDLDTFSMDGWTLIPEAIRHARLDVIKLLMSLKFEREPRDYDRRVFIRKAAEYGQLDILEYLLDLDQHRPVANWSGDVLTAAAMNGHLETLQYLVGRVEQVNSWADLQRTDIMEAACNGGHLHVVEYIDRSNAGFQVDTSAMDEAARHGHYNIVEYLHIHRTEGCTTNALDKAVISGYEDIVRFLLLNRTEG